MSVPTRLMMFRVATLLGLGFILASCATHPEVRSQAAANANLASYHTYEIGRAHV